jgi:hypothetical protein
MRYHPAKDIQLVPLWKSKDGFSQLFDASVRGCSMARDDQRERWRSDVLLLGF